MLKQFIFAIFLFSSGFTGFSTALNVHFKNCGETGWTCNNQTVVTTLIYSCQHPSYRWNPYGQQIEIKVKGNAKIDLSEWSMPYSLTNLTIYGCNELTLGLHLDKFTLETLYVNDIDNLVIIPSASQKHPLRIEFRNITNIERLPTRTIVDNRTESVIFKDVNIALIEKEAIFLSNEMERFEWTGLNISKIMNYAVSIRIKNQASFMLRGCNFPALKLFSFHVIGGSVQMIQNNFDVLGLAALKVISDSFIFDENIIMFNSSRAILVKSPDVVITNNQFRETNFDDLFLWTTTLKRSSFPNYVSVVIKNNLINVSEEENYERNYYVNHKPRSVKETKSSRITTSIYEMNNSSTCFSQVFLKDIDTEFSSDVSIVTSFIANSTCASQDKCVSEEKWRPIIQLCNTDSAI